MSTVLVAGATGYLGRHIVEELHRRGRRVRAVVRDRARAEKEGPWKSPPLKGLVEEWAVGDVAEPDFVKDLAKGAAQVVSALGVTRQKADPWQIDNLTTPFSPPRFVTASPRSRTSTSLAERNARPN